MVFLVFRHTCISAPKTFAYYAFLARFDGISVERFGQAVARITINTIRTEFIVPKFGQIITIS